MQLIQRAALTAILIAVAIVGATAVGQQRTYPPAQFVQSVGVSDKMIEHTVDVFSGLSITRPRSPEPRARTISETYPAPDGQHNAQRECVRDETLSTVCALYLQRGDARTRIADSTYQGDPVVAWSPDGTRLYLLAHPPAETNVAPNIYRYSLADERLHTRFDGYTVLFQCEDGGQWCSFYERTGPSNYQLFLLDMTTDALTLLADEVGLSYRPWLAGAPTLVYQRHTADGSEIVRYNAATGDETVLYRASDAAITGFGFAEGGDRWLAVRAHAAASAENTLYMVDAYADPPSARTVYTGVGPREPLRWTPDGTHALFRAGPQDDYNLYSVTPQGDPVPLTDFAHATTMRLQFSDDSHWLLLMVRFRISSVMHSRPELYRIPVDGSAPPVQVPVSFYWDFNDWRAWFAW